MSGEAKVARFVGRYVAEAVGGGKIGIAGAEAQAGMRVHEVFINQAAHGFITVAGKEIGLQVAIIVSHTRSETHFLVHLRIRAYRNKHHEKQKT